MKKSIITGIICGMMLVSSVIAGAVTINLDGYLYTRNPVWGAPQGYAVTYGFQECTALVNASKDGVTNSQSASGTNKAETEWVSGPTYAAAGTSFTSTHTGYDYYGTYQVKYGSASF